MVDQSSFHCSCCGQLHDGPPLAWHLNAPDVWSTLSTAERKRRGELSSDQCVIDDKYFFIRGLVEIPVLDGEGPFDWGVWVSLSKASFDRTSELWEEPSRISEPPYFGWFSNSLPGYPETLNLKVAVHYRAVGVRPFLELEATDHPLSQEQANGITVARIQQIAEQMHHHNSELPRTRKRFGLF